MSPTTPPPPCSSSAFAPAITLRPRPSPWLAFWWGGLNAALAGAALLVNLPWPLRLLAFAAVLTHAIVRSPGRATPKLLLVGADGACALPGREAVLLGAGSGWTRYSVRLVNRQGKLDVLLLADQLEAGDWARLSALLRRLPSG